MSPTGHHRNLGVCNLNLVTYSSILWALRLWFLSDLFPDRMTYTHLLLHVTQPRCKASLWMVPAWCLSFQALQTDSTFYLSLVSLGCHQTQSIVVQTTQLPPSPTHRTDVLAVEVCSPVSHRSMADGRITSRKTQPSLLKSLFFLSINLRSFELNGTSWIFNRAQMLPNLMTFLCLWMTQLLPWRAGERERERKKSLSNDIPKLLLPSVFSCLW